MSSIDTSFKRLFIDPDHNFAFCPLEKVASSQWRTVLRNVMDNRTDKGHGWVDFNIGPNSQEKHGGARAVQQILESPTSTVAVMVRDPLARFASVFFNKCFEANCTNGFCAPRNAYIPSGRTTKVPSGQVISFRHALDWILQDSVDVSKIDSHWSLQSVYCGMNDGGLEKYYSIIGLMTKKTLNQDAACIMDRAGVGQYNLPVPGGNSSDGTFWGEGGVKFNKGYRTATEEDVLKKLYTPEMARLFMQKFQKDYDTFQLPEPDWVDDATGEWLDSLDHHKMRIVQIIIERNFLYLLHSRESRR